MQQEKAIPTCMLNTDEIISKVKASYLALLGPDISRPEDQEAIRRIIQLSPEVSPKVVRMLIQTGFSWRERLVGVVLSVEKGPAEYLDAYVDVLKEPMGFEIVPTFAAVYCALKPARIKHLPLDLNLLARSEHDWEIGWGLEKVCFELGFDVLFDPGDVGPITGLSFRKYVNAYRWIQKQ